MSNAEPRTCSIARTLDVVGEKWALLAVREVFLGNRRFDEMVHRTGAPRDTLAARLRTLVAAGILERRQYCAHPARFEYHLTAAGRDLYPVIVTLMRWGDQYLAGEDGPPLVLEHHCGHELTAQVICQACGEPLRAGHTRPLIDHRLRRLRRRVNVRLSGRPADRDGGAPGARRGTRAPALLAAPGAYRGRLPRAAEHRRWPAAAAEAAAAAAAAAPADLPN